MFAAAAYCYCHRRVLPILQLLLQLSLLVPLATTFAGEEGVEAGTESALASSLPILTSLPAPLSQPPPPFYCRHHNH